MNMIQEEEKVLDERKGRTNDISLITLKITAYDNDKIVFVRRFPLPKKPRKAIGLVHEKIDLMLELGINPQRLEFDFYDVPRSVFRIFKTRSKWEVLKNMLSGQKTIWIPFLGAIKKSYPKAIVKLHSGGEQIVV
jgi:hypothetical protein